MSLGMATIAALALFAQAPSAPATPRGDKEFDLPAAFSKRIPETVQDLKDIEAHVRKLTKKVTAATVGIRIGNTSGSGIIIDREGHVLTAGHVSGDPDRDCTIILPDGRKLKGRTRGANRAIDSGMIIITETAEFPHAELAKSSDLKRGDWCLALGHPGGYQPGRTPVVRLGRILENNPKFLRTDCTLVGGDSGGPLFDMNGQVIGIHSRIGNAITANIHVPADTYKETFDKLAKAEVWGNNVFGGFSEAFLGVQVDPEAKVCKIQTVSANSPAEKAGLKVNDLILQCDGKDVATGNQFLDILRKRSPGNELTLVVRRGEELFTVAVKLGRRPAG
jgi:serine protease Do